jgi:DNA-binding CsgD family transcriptional regulator/tetratricopeptide (TPR) repeat protein
LTGEDVLDVLGQLVDKSLVQTSERAGATRYAFLETIRAFASERLGESGEEAAMRERHATFFLGFAEQAGPGIRGPDQQRWIEQLQVEYDNLRAAARWFGDDSAGAPLGLRLAAALWEFWHVRGYLGEASRWLEAALEADPAASVARAEALDGLGVVTALRGDHPRAVTLFGESETLFGVLGRQAGRAHAMSNWGIASLMGGNAVQATELSQQAVTIARSTGDGWAEAYAQYALGWASRFSGDVELSLRCVADSAALFGSVGDERGRAFSLHLLGPLLMDSGHVAEALGPLREAVATFAILEDTWGILNVLSQSVRPVAELGEVQRAARLLGASRALRERIGAELIPMLQLAEDRGAALARSHLGEAAFEAAVLAGRGLSLDEAIAEVLRPTQTSAPQSLAPGTVPPRILTRREGEVAELIAEGLTNRQIADRLVIAERTADTHVQNILAKLGYVSRAQITALLQSNAES